MPQKKVTRVEFPTKPLLLSQSTLLKRVAAYARVSTMETSFISVVVFAIVVTSIQAPFGELLEATDGADVVPRFRHDLMERKPVHGIVADGTAELHGSTDALGLQEGVNVDGYSDTHIPHTGHRTCSFSYKECSRCLLSASICGLCR